MTPAARLEHEILDWLGLGSSSRPHGQSSDLRFSSGHIGPLGLICFS